jgi:general secretion pathway protein H
MSEPSRPVPLSAKPGLLPGEARGYTLLELIVVLLILGAAAAVVAPSVGSLLWRSRLDQATERAASLLHDARAAAARSGRSVTVELSADGRELRSPTDTLRLEPPLRIEASQSERTVVFYPTGLAAGARWIVRDSEGEQARTAVIEVSLLAGEVVVRRP